MLYWDTDVITVTNIITTKKGEIYFLNATKISSSLYVLMELMMHYCFGKKGGRKISLVVKSWTPFWNEYAIFSLYFILLMLQQQQDILLIFPSRFQKWGAWFYDRRDFTTFLRVFKRVFYSYKIEYQEATLQPIANHNTL